ncbi:hypothetical protein PROFUN_14322 [Planoprotostelium fungivorum]|uniref:Uncharacterized protein n=1 Tax=Planoprotostelium fungivorum TaxID=1890364 RepID=A0A2P6N0I8_9EUKA|nr:hypothetical protein PROFUN_14322 [Planoprotostelium fungivorum]
MRHAFFFLVVLALASAKCSLQMPDRPARQIVCGILEELLVFNATGCKTDFTNSGTELSNGFRGIGAGIKAKSTKAIKNGLVLVGTGLRDINRGLNDCGITSGVSIVANGAVSFSSGIAVITQTVKILIRGENIYNDIWDIYTLDQAADYDAVGHKLVHLLKLIVAR